jgi:hypothetical protein
MASPVKITISVADEKMDRMSDVVADLKKAGVNVEQTLDSIGTIVASVDEANLASVSQVPGVGSVEREGTFQLPPPDSDVQ